MILSARHLFVLSRFPGRYLAGGILAATIVFAGGGLQMAHGQSDGVRVGVDPPRRATDIESEGVGVPMSMVVRDTAPPYERVFRDVRVGGRLEPRLGPSGEGDLRLAILRRGVWAATPIQRGGRPEDAELKLGPLYWDLRNVSASGLYSDNVRLSETDPEDGAIAILRARSRLTLQLGENLRLSVLATLIYLPFQGEIGVAGFGMSDPLAAFQNQPLFRSQLAYDLRVGEWDILLINDTSARHNSVGFRYSFDVLDGVTFDEEDRAGRYVFRDRTRAFRGSGRDRLHFDNDYITLYNLSGGAIGRVLPTVTRAEAGAYHVRYWYYGRRDGLELPRTRDILYGGLISERETMRFKPYVWYRASRTGSNPFDQRVIGGFSGPVTDNITLSTDAGVFMSGRSDRERLIWRIRLDHMINSRTFHKVQYSRRVTEPDRDLDESVMYLIRRDMGPYLFGEAFGKYSNFEGLDEPLQGGEEYLAGVRFTSYFGLRTMARVGVLYSKIDYNNPAFGSREKWRVRSKLRYRHRSENWEWWLIHQYHTQRATGRARNYDENVVMLTLTRWF